MKTSKKEIILGSLLMLLVVGGFSVYQYVYADHRDIASARVDFELPTTQLGSVMQEEVKAAEFIDKVIQTYGKVTSIEQNSIIINEMIQVNFIQEKVTQLQLNDDVTIKGRCVGYDDLLELVKIDQATLIN